MNKKGMTLVEIIVAISLISVVMVFLFQVLITVVNGNKRNNTKSKTLISKAIVMKAVEHDLDTFGLQDNTSVEECGTFDGISDSAKNQIIPIAARSNDYYCIKITYNPSNVKNSEGYLIFYQNNEKGFLAYKRGKTTDQGFIIESQVIREIDAIPQMLESNEIISKQNEGSLYSIKINFPIIATDGNNYDLTINYIYGSNLDYLPSESFDFANDPWKKIAENVKNGNSSAYTIGDEKEVKIDGKDYTVRIANNSTPEECNSEGFSQTACGFVIEFVDIITGYNMNPAGKYNGVEHVLGTNIGGWPGSAMYKYVNGDTSDHLTYDGTNATIYSKLPSELQEVIINTYTVSGHGSIDTGTREDSNWESNDKLYLLTTGEIWSNCTTGNNCYDTASYNTTTNTTTTRQLDYYSSRNVTTSSNYSNAIKNYNSSATWWWLRSGRSDIANSFLSVHTLGVLFDSYAYGTNEGLAPAFRIG